MSQIYKKLNIEDAPSSTPPVADLKLVQSVQEPFRPAGTAPAKAKTQSRVLYWAAFVVLVGASWFAFHRANSQSSSGLSAENAIQNSNHSPAVQKQLVGDELVHAEAMELFRTKEYGKALEKFESLLEKHPNDAALLNNIGLTATKLNDFRKAEKRFQEALKIAPKDSAIYNNLGSLKMAELDPEEAISYFYQAILYHPEMIEAHLNLAKADELSGNSIEAIPEYQYYLDHAPAGADPGVRKLIEKRIATLRTFSRTNER